MGINIRVGGVPILNYFSYKKILINYFKVSI